METVQNALNWLAFIVAGFGGVMALGVVGWFYIRSRGRMRGH